MDADLNIEIVVLGQRSGLISIIYIEYMPKTLKSKITNQIEFGFHTSAVLGLKLSKSGQIGISYAVQDNYLAIWSVDQMVLL